MKLNKKIEKIILPTFEAYLYFAVNENVENDIKLVVSKIKQLILKEIMKNAPKKEGIKKIEEVGIKLMTLASNTAIDQYTKAIEEVLTIQEGKK